MLNRFLTMSLTVITALFLIKEKNINYKPVLQSPHSTVVYLPKTTADYYLGFGKTITWLLLNRYDNRVTIRPILSTKTEHTFNPKHAIKLEPFRVKKGENISSFQNPEQTITDGFHIHVDHELNHKVEADKLFAIFKHNISAKRISYSALDTYPENSNGPHLRAGWEIKFEKTGAHVFENYGYSIAWLALNHGNVPVYSHAKNWVYGQNEQRLISHWDYSLYIGDVPKLNQWFFYNPMQANSGLYRWDIQLPLKKQVSVTESQAKQQEILDFWFGDLKQGYPDEKSKLWFTQQDSQKNKAFDQLIRKKYQRDLVLASLESYDDWQKTAKGRLALIILFDQFPRNMFRGTPQAFAYDKLAKKIMQQGLDKGDDKKLSLAERLFFYMPLEHSEKIEDQEQAVKLIKKLYDKAPKSLKEKFKVHYIMALMHKEAVEKFGRFPWRKATFGVETTRDEKVFLEKPSHRA